MAPDKISPSDPRVQFRSAHLNGRTYGYLFCEPLPSTPHRGYVFLIHGFPDLSFGWRYQIPLLTSLGLTCIAPDCMGYGRTDAPLHTLRDYTYKRAADDLATLARQLGITQCIIGGHDWGGAVVYRVALYYPRLISALFSICTPYAPPTQTYEPLELFVANRIPFFGYQVHFVSGEVEDAVQSPREIRNFLNGLYGGRTTDGPRGVAWNAERGVDLSVLPRMGKTKLLSDDEMEYYVREYARHGIHGPLNWYRTRELNYVDELRHFFGGPALPHVYSSPSPNGASSTSGSSPESRPDTSSTDGTAGQKKRVNWPSHIPVLFVGATNDAALKPETARKMPEQIPHLTTRQVNTGHWALWEKPEDVNRFIRDWLEEKVFPNLEPVSTGHGHHADLGGVSEGKIVAQGKGFMLDQPEEGLEFEFEFKVRDGREGRGQGGEGRIIAQGKGFMLDQQGNRVVVGGGGGGRKNKL